MHYSNVLRISNSHIKCANIKGLGIGSNTGFQIVKEFKTYHISSRRHRPAQSCRICRDGRRLSRAASPASRIPTRERLSRRKLPARKNRFSVLPEF